MSGLLLERVATSALSLEPSLENNCIKVTLVGTGDMNAITELNEYLTRVHAEAQRLVVPEVICDLRQLSFMNSSCFKAFVTWIDTVKNDKRPYRIRLLASSTLPWQRRSLEALRRLAVGVVSVEQS